jgi:hypothetical protein
MLCLPHAYAYFICIDFDTTTRRHVGGSARGLGQDHADVDPRGRAGRGGQAQTGEAAGRREAGGGRRAGKEKRKELNCIKKRNDSSDLKNSRLPFSFFLSYFFFLFAS